MQSKSMSSPPLRRKVISSLEKTIVFISVLSACALLLLGLHMDIEAIEVPSEANNQDLLNRPDSRAAHEGDALTSATNGHTRVVHIDARTIPTDELRGRVKKTSKGARTASVAIAAHNSNGAKPHPPSAPMHRATEKEQKFGYLQVTIEPSTARENNARWKIHGSGMWRRSNEKIEVPVGVVRIKCNRIRGFKRPSTQAVEINPEKLTLVKVKYREN